VVTWPDLQRIGVACRRAGGELVFDAPEHLHGLVRSAIHARATMMAAPPRLVVPRGCCDACGGGMQGLATGGWCCLCEAGRAVAMREGKLAA
jgi:hypothetical protein